MDILRAVGALSAPPKPENAGRKEPDPSPSPPDVHSDGAEGNLMAQAILLHERAASRARRRSGRK